MQVNKNRKIKLFMQYAGGISLLLLPLALMVAFGLHFNSLSEFFVFKLKYEPNSTNEFMATLIGPSANRLFIIPHGVGYLSLPLFIATALTLSQILFKKKPWFAIVGTSLTSIGTVYMGGVFGTWLSFSALANLAPDQIDGAIPALAALTEMRGVLLFTSILSVLSLLGLMVLAVGLYLSRIVPRWSAIMIFIGNLIIIVFMDLDNWMLVGALLILIGMIPISLRLLNNRDEMWV